MPLGRSRQSKIDSIGKSRAKRGLNAWIQLRIPQGQASRRQQIRRIQQIESGLVRDGVAGKIFI